MNTSTVVWSAVWFISGYAGVMASQVPTGYFSWAAVVAGIASLIAYHSGKSQETGGLVDAARKAMAP